MKTIITTLILLAGATALATKPTQDDSLKVVLKLRNVNNVLTFNQPHVSPNTLEYLWEVKINSDNDINTGDAQGYDVGLALLNIKYGTSVSYTGTIISGSDQYTRIYSGGTISYGNPMTVYFDFADTSLIITAPKSYSELIPVGAGDPFCVHTFFNSPAGTETDNTIPSTICQLPLADVTGDVTSSFVDIKSVEFKTGITVGNHSHVIQKENILIYPNPCSARLFITNTGKEEVLTEIYDNTGNKILSTTLAEINTENYSKGLYHIICTSRGNLFKTNLIIN
jgi:hypothetical protein